MAPFYVCRSHFFFETLWIQHKWVRRVNPNPQLIQLWLCASMFGQALEPSFQTYATKKNDFRCLHFRYIYLQGCLVFSLSLFNPTNITAKVY